MGVEPIIFWLWASYLNRFTHPQVVATGFEPANLTVAFSAVHRLLSLTRMKSLSLVWYRRNILNGDQPSLHSCPHLTFTAGTIQSSSYDALDATVLEQEVGVQRFELWTSRSQSERATKLRHTPKWNGFRPSSSLRQHFYRGHFSRPGSRLLSALRTQFFFLRDSLTRFVDNLCKSLTISYLI